MSNFWGISLFTGKKPQTKSTALRTAPGVIFQEKSHQELNALASYLRTLANTASKRFCTDTEPLNTSNKSIAGDLFTSTRAKSKVAGNLNTTTTVETADTIMLRQNGSEIAKVNKLLATPEIHNLQAHLQFLELQDPKLFRNPAQPSELSSVIIGGNKVNPIVGSKQPVRIEILKPGENLAPIIRIFEESYHYIFNTDIPPDSLTGKTVNAFLDIVKVLIPIEERNKYKVGIKNLFGRL